MKRFLLAACGAASTICAAHPALTAVPPIPPSAPSKPAPPPYAMRPIGSNAPFAESFALSTGSNDPGGTLRQSYTTVGPISQLGLVFYNGQVAGSPGIEIPGQNNVLQTACIEIPNTGTYGNIVECPTVGGQSLWVNPSNAPGVATDIIGAPLAGATLFYVRTWTGVPMPPASPSATVVAGGALPTGVAQYYKIVSLCYGQKSAASSEVSATPSGSNLAVTLAWTAPACADHLDFYRGTSTGAESFLAEIVATSSTVNWTDLGYVAVTPNSAPPSTALKVVYSHFLRAGDSANNVPLTGNGANAANATGGITGRSGFGVVESAGPGIVYGDDVNATANCGVGDSIIGGTGISLNSAGYLTTTNQGAANWFNIGSTMAGQPSVNFGIPSSTEAGLIANQGQFQFTWRWLKLCQRVWDEGGHNDGYVYATTWQQLALYKIAMGKVLRANGQKYYVTLLTPTTTSTDGFTTVSGQTKDSHESTFRLPFNAWVQNGFQVSGGTPCNTAGCGAQITGADPTGTVAPVISGYYNLASAIEVNSSGILTVGGGYILPASATPVLSGGTVAAGSTTSQINVSDTLTYQQFPGMEVVFKSGAQSGKCAIISLNTASYMTVIPSGGTLFTGLPTSNTGCGLTVAPAAGDHYNIVAPTTVDGVHFSLAGQALQAASFGAFLPTVP